MKARLNLIIALSVLNFALVSSSSLLNSRSTNQIAGPPKPKLVIPKQCNLTFVKHLIPPTYPFESHKTTTEDGYVLTLFRLQAKGTTITGGKPVVFLQHGLNNGGLTWLSNGDKEGLAFELANQGFDVWIGNNRGTRYSRTHIKYLVTDKAFWQYSFDELAKYDVPANIATIKQITGADKINYIGHSQGTSQMFAALSDPEIRPKVAPFIRQFHALAPIVFLDQPQGGTAAKLAAGIKASAQRQALDLGVDYLNIGTCVWDQTFIDYWNKLCTPTPTPAQCIKTVRKENVYPQVSKIDNFPRNGYRQYIANSGASVNCLLHYSQLILAQIKNPDVFPKFDYGSAAANTKKYGQPTPPNYDLTLIKEKVRMWVGTGDTLATIPEAIHIG